MNQRVDALAKAASLLKPEDRLKLIDRILESVHPTTPEVDKAWLSEAERRWAAYERGEIETYDADEVIAELRQKSARKTGARNPRHPRRSVRQK